MQENGRGYGNIAKVKAPAFILEPAFVDNPAHLRAYREHLSALSGAIVRWATGKMHP